jgi:hypothetical protein
MNRNDLKYEPHPVLVKREVIEAYKQHFAELIAKSWEPGGFNYLGMASEAEYVLEGLLEVPKSEVEKLLNEALKNESKTNNRDMPDQEES